MSDALVVFVGFVVFCCWFVWGWFLCCLVCCCFITLSALKKKTCPEAGMAIREVGVQRRLIRISTICVCSGSCGLEMDAMSVSLGSKELGINLFVMKKEAGYWKLKVILFNIYLTLCSSSRSLFPSHSLRSSDSWIFGCGWSLGLGARVTQVILRGLTGSCFICCHYYWEDIYIQSVLLLGMQKANDSYGDRKCVLKTSWGFTRLKQRASDELQSQKSVQQANLFSKAQSLTMILYRLVALSMSWHMQCMYFKLEKNPTFCQTCVSSITYFVPVKTLKHWLGHFYWFSSLELSMADSFKVSMFGWFLL